MQFQGISFRLGVVVPLPQVDVFRNVCAVVWAFAFGSVSEWGVTDTEGCRGADADVWVGQPVRNPRKMTQHWGFASISMRYFSSRRRKVFAEDMRDCKEGSFFLSDLHSSVYPPKVLIILFHVPSAGLILLGGHGNGIVSPAIRIFSFFALFIAPCLISRLCMGPL